MTESRTKLKAAVSTGLILVLLTALVSGVSNFVNAWVAKGTNTNTDVFFTARNVLVAAALLPVAFLARRDVRARLRRSDWGRLALIGLIGGAVPFLLYFRGVQIATTAGGFTSARFGFSALFLMATAFAVIFLRERVSARVLLAGIALLAGCALLLLTTEPVWSDGIVLVLLATALWAGEYTLSKRTLRDLPSGTVAAGRMGFGAVFLLGYLGISGQLGGLAALPSGQWPWVALSAILLLGFVCTWYAGLKHVDLSVATAVLVLGYPITWALRVAWGLDAFTVAQAAGAAAVVFGVVLVVGLVSVRDVLKDTIRVVARLTPR